MKEKENIEITIDKNGNWTSPYGEIKHPRVLKYFSKILNEKDGEYFLSNGLNKVKVNVEATPFFVEAIREKKNKDGSTTLILIINDGTEEPLDPSSITILKDNSVICRIKKGKFWAKFTLSAYWQLTEHIFEKDGKFYLKTHGKNWELEVSND